jgi:hypothetical protein
MIELAHVLRCARLGTPVRFNAEVLPGARKGAEDACYPGYARPAAV